MKSPKITSASPFGLTLLTFAILICFTDCKKEENPGPGEVEECPLNETEKGIISDLNTQYAYPFNSATPDETDAQLDPLIEYLNNAKFVGLGESTHGTREFYRMKDKIFRLLVTEKGFKAIIFEIPWGNAMVVNDYVVNDIGSADNSVNQTVYWTYDTQEVRDMALWIHDYNQSLPETERILFVGNDPQGEGFDIEKGILSAYINEVQPDSVVSILSNYNSLPSGNLFDYPAIETEIKQANIQGTKKVYGYLVDNEEDFVNQTSNYEYQVALMAAHVVQHREFIYRTSNFGVSRDSLMAIYSEWWQEILGENSQVAIWAHNNHVMDATGLNAYWMGTYLKERHGENYQSVGFSFGTGSFNAFLADINFNVQAGVQKQSILELECNTINNLLTQVEGDQHYLIFEELDGEAKTYFNSDQFFVNFGAGFNVVFINNYKRPSKMAQLHDVLIHFDETNASLLR